MSPSPSLAVDGGCQIGDVTLRATDPPQTRREKLARIVLDAMYQFVGLLDAQGTTLEINRAALDGAGLRFEDIRGRPFWEARWFQVSRESVALQRDIVRRAAAGEFVRCDLEVYGQAAGDETIVVDYSLMPVRDDQGEVVFLLAEGRNISAKKRAEAEVVRKNAELQDLLDQVRRLDQLKSDLFAKLSHEFRTPLTLILGPVEDLLEQGAGQDPAQRERLQLIRRSAETLLGHVNDLLDLARVDAGHMAPSYARVDLAALVRHVAQPFQWLAPKRALSYTVSTPPSLPAAVDPRQFERMLQNLLSNAFKFTPAGGRIRCVLEPLGGTRCLLKVQDSGPGVPAAQRQAIFDRFHQGSAAAAGEQSGSGLGLAIVKELVQLHGGVIGVSDAPGGGALFQLELPLQPGEEHYLPDRPLQTAFTSAPRALPELDAVQPAEAVCAAVPGEAEALDTDGVALPPGRATVLLVEDHAEMRRFVREALGHDHRVLAVGDGQTALQQALAAPPDLIVTDLMMPGLSGDRLIQAIREAPALAEVPVLVLSARDDHALRTRLLAQAAQDYLTKPFSAHELRARVRNLVSMKLARDAMRQALASQSDDLSHLAHQLIVSRRALQESEQRWWAIYEHSPVGIALLDGAERILGANPAFSRMLGHTDAQIRRCGLADITPPGEQAASRERVARVLAGEVREYHVQRRFLHRDGQVVWASTSVAQVPDAAAGAPLLLVVAEDITEQKAAEEALAKAREALAQVTRASALGEMAASLAHEINQPLAAVAANAQAGLRWLDAQPPNEPQARAALDRIVRDARRAADIIGRTRAFLQRGASRRQPVALAAAVAEVIELVRAEAQSRRVALQVAAPDGLPAVLADTVQVQQVVLNLVMNGMEAIGRDGAGPRWVRVTLGRHDAASLRVQVEDAGPGLDPQAGEEIFQAFHTSKPQGLGMGLAISRGIVESHGGRLWTEQRPGAGATFCFTLPVAGEGAAP